MSQLEDLAQHRDAILLAEIAAWLHMLGKYDWQFIESQCGGTTSYDYQNFMANLSAQYPKLFGLLDPASSEYQAIFSTLPITAPTNGGVFIRDHRETNKARQNNLADELTMLLVDAHGRGSNIDKSEIKADFPIQTVPNIYLSTAFGFEYQLSPCRYRTSALHDELEAVISQLPNHNWNNIIGELRQKIDGHFRSALAETRLPFNDVTLFDQTASSVSFFKSALAERVVAGKWKPLISDSVTQYQWRTLTIPFTGLAYLQNVSGIVDLLGRKNTLTRAQNELRTLIEITYPIGQEIYRDEQTSIFLVPDEAGLLQWQDKNGQSLKTLIQQQVVETTKGDLYPDLQDSLMPHGTRTVYTIGQQLDASSKVELTSDAARIAEAWDRAHNCEICANCGLRPQDPSDKASGRKLCDICLERRDERSKDWATNQLERTIWLDEVADNNGRLALLAGWWDFAQWLDGTFISTIIAASSVDFLQLEQDCRKSLATTRKGNPQEFQGLLTEKVAKKAREQFSNQFRPYFEAIIQPEWQHLTTTAITEETIAAMHFVRQNPSFARLRRVWETTRQFWQDVCPTDAEQDIGQSLVGQTIKARPARLKITGTLTPQGTKKTLGRYHAYDLKLTGSVKLSVVWDPLKACFITCDNLEYLAKPELLGCPVSDLLPEGKTISIEEPTGYGSQNKIWGEITIQEVETLPASIYTPAIPILAEPRTFMALVPADKALEVAQAIKAKYEREMGKVRNRLPLHLGLVYAHRRTPLRTILDAGQRMLRQKPPGGDQLWRVQADATRVALPGAKQCLAQGTQQFQQTIAVHLEQGERFFTWYVPAVMGDGQTDDNWYPYVFFQADKAGNTDPTQATEKRLRVFKGVRPTANGQTEACRLVHAGELKAGDQVYFTPATLDFEWLDTAARRFAIAYDEQSGRRRGRLTRPYLLDDLSTPAAAWECIGGQEGLTSSQIYALRDLVEARRAAWFDQPAQSLTSEPFRQLCRDAVVNAEWKQTPSNEQKDQVVSWLVSGLFADMVELFMSIMKAKPERNEETL
ncbi:MAG: CRISPR-associated protein Csx11 [Chloroflexaceae bacterium]